MHVLITGASGVLGRALVPHLQAAGHTFDRPSQRELDLFDANAVNAAVAGCDAVVHLASRIPPRERMGDPSAWRDNDRLRSTTSRLLVDALLQESGAEVYVVPTVTMLYQIVPADERTPIGNVPAHLRSAIVAEQQAHRATDNGIRGIILRLGRLYGPGTEAHSPRPHGERHPAHCRRRRRAEPRAVGTSRYLQRMRRRWRDRQRPLQGRDPVASQSGPTDPRALTGRKGWGRRPA